MEKIDVLYGKFLANVGGNGAADSARNKFIVNTAVNEVNINVAAALWYFIFQKPLNGAKHLYARDNIRILSIGLVYPHGFSFGKVLPILKVERYVTRVNGTTYSDPLPELQDGAFSYSEVEIPFPNYEMALDIPSAFPDQIAGATSPAKYLIRCTIEAGDVSMINAAAATNGLEYTPIPFIKILHTNSLSVG